MDKQALPRHGRRALATTVALAALSLFSAGPAAADNGCTKAAAPAGSDSAEGTEAAPYASVQKLVEALGPGETGCLRQGTYGGDPVSMREPDSTLKSYPGERATVKAFLEVYPGAARAHVTGLRFDSGGNGNSVAVKLQADGAVFSDNEVTKSGQGICILAGSWNAARGVVIERNRIHDCGPAGSKYDHDIYLSGTRDAVVRWNILSADAGGFGVHMYPDADGTVVEHNVIDGNHGGVVFAGNGSEGASDHNLVRNNAITFSGPRWNVESSWSGGAAGVGNSVDHNCVYSPGAEGRSGIGERDGFTSQSNTVLNGSPYVNRADGDYRFRADSPCATLVGDVEGVISGHPSSPPQPPVQVLLVTPTVTSASTAARQPARTVVLRGRVKSHRRVRRVALQARGRHGWRLVKVRRVGRHGKFTARIRVRRSSRARTLRLRAVVPKLARSRTVRVRVRA
jgi:parallel beta helix pectate lyase-like protein